LVLSPPVERIRKQFENPKFIFEEAIFTAAAADARHIGEIDSEDVRPPQ
jgi:hypothetical protein